VTAVTVDAGAGEPGLEAAKAAVRSAVLRRRAARPEQDRLTADEARTRLLLARLDQRPPGLVAAYLSAGVEPGTLNLIAWLASRDIAVMLPVVGARPDGTGPGEPAWALYTGPEALRVGPLSILEPTGEALPATAIAAADLVICPGLAGTPGGARLGRGSGWYDRALPYVADAAQIWMLLNDDEVLDDLPTARHDRRVHTIVTPLRFLDCVPRTRPVG
jgi:5-formyltetrahydrofolate cyclo-ligase